MVVIEAQAAMIRAAYESGGEFSAAVELRELFPPLRTLRRRGVHAGHGRLATAGGLSDWAQ
jgi:hypothetical protein